MTDGRLLVASARESHVVLFAADLPCGATVADTDEDDDDDDDDDEGVDDELWWCAMRARSLSAECFVSDRASGSAIFINSCSVKWLLLLLLLFDGRPSSPFGRLSNT